MSEQPLENAMLSSLETVRRLDHDRLLTALLAPADRRARLIALYAFNAEIARVRETVSEPMLGQIRLQWWRETVESLANGEARGHETAEALLGAFGKSEVDAPALIALIDARERDLDDEPFETMQDLIAYCEGTSSSLMTLAAKALSPEETQLAKEILKSAGVAFALTGLLRALPMHASQGRLYLPLDLLQKHAVDPHQIFSGEMTEGLRAVVHEVAVEAEKYLTVSRETRPGPSRKILPALWPASLCDLYLKKMTEPDFNPFEHTTELPAYRLQSRFLGRKLIGRF
ncbi:MAG: phytoene/squalene synthase family protein [Parvibaculum sp.]